MGIKYKLDFRINENGCFIVKSHKPNTDGYCNIYINHKMRRAHRHVYEECFGEIAEGLVVRHKCDVRNCINPEHLELGTIKQNARDAIDRGRNALGEKNGGSKIDEDIARKIKIMIKDGLNSREISRRLNVGYKIVRGIRQYNTWKHVAV